MHHLPTWAYQKGIEVAALVAAQSQGKADAKSNSQKNEKGYLMRNEETSTDPSKYTPNMRRKSIRRRSHFPH